MKTVVSVSMSPELASTVRASAGELGQSFSARVCELVEGGIRQEAYENRELTANFGGPVAPRKLFEKTSDEDAPSIHEEAVTREVTVLRDETGSGLSAVSHALGSPSEIDSAKETVAESPRPSGTPLERVFHSVSTAHLPVPAIAEAAGVSVEVALEALDHLIDEDDAPFSMVREGGEWFCWRVG